MLLPRAAMICSTGGSELPSKSTANTDESEFRETYPRTKSNTFELGRQIRPKGSGGAEFCYANPINWAREGDRSIALEVQRVGIAPRHEHFGSEPIS